MIIFEKLFILKNMKVFCPYSAFISILLFSRVSDGFSLLLPNNHLQTFPKTCSYLSDCNNHNVFYRKVKCEMQMTHDPNVIKGATTDNEDPKVASRKSGQELPLLLRKKTSMFDKIKVLWDFSRPHTFIGTALSIPAIHFFAVPNFWTPSYLYSILFCLIPSAFVNIYITGLNQIFDVEIDSVNKPFLPIPSGQLSKRKAILIVGFCLLCSVGFVLSPGFEQSVYRTKALQSIIISSATFGTLYSVPPFRLKQFPLLASLCIVMVRGIILHFGFYQHASDVAVSCLFPKLSERLVPFFDFKILQNIDFFQNKKCVMLTLFFTLFSFVIALMKDVSDIKGDARNSIKSFSVQKGPPFMFHLSNNILSSLFVGTSMFLLSSIFSTENVLSMMGKKKLTGGEAFQSIPFLIYKFIISISAFANGLILYRKGKKINTNEEKKTYEHYMFVWKLFYASYLVLPLLA